MPPFVLRVTMSFALTWSMVCSAGAAEWHLEKEAEGSTVYSREVTDSAVREYRVDMQLPAPVEDVWAALVDPSFFGDHPRVITRDFLSQQGGISVVYQRDDCSPIKPRDYAMTMVESRRGDAYVLTTDLANEHAPEPEDGVVRISAFRSQWTLTADGEGTAIEYVLFYDAGGRVPAKLYNWGMPSNLVAIRDRLLQYALARAD
jgi:hypothetical protein